MKMTVGDVLIDLTLSQTLAKGWFEPIKYYMADSTRENSDNF